MLTIIALFSLHYTVTHIDHANAQLIPLQI